MGLVVDFAGEQLHAHEGTLSNSRATSVQPFFQSLQHQDVVMTLYSFRVEAPGWSDLCDFWREASRRRSAELSSRAESEGAEAENSEAWCEPFIQGAGFFARVGRSEYGAAWKRGSDTRLLVALEVGNLHLAIWREVGKTDLPLLEKDRVWVVRAACERFQAMPSGAEGGLGHWAEEKTEGCNSSVSPLRA